MDSPDKQGITPKTNTDTTGDQALQVPAFLGKQISLSKRLQQGLAQLELAATGKAERVPLMAQCGPHNCRLVGISVRDYLTDPEMFIASNLLVTEYYGFDAPPLTYDLYNIEAEALGQSLRWVDGQLPEIDLQRMLIRQPNDLDRLQPPKFDRTGRMPVIAEIYRRLVDLGLTPTLRFASPFSLAANIRGVENLVMDIMERPEFAHRLFRFVTHEVLIPWIDTLRIAAGQNLTAMGADAMASLPIVNPTILEEFALGYIMQINTALGDVGSWGWWGESWLREPETMMALKLQGCPSMVMGEDPDVYAIGPERYARFARRHHVPLCLSVSASLMAAGPVSEIVARICNYIRMGNSQSGLMLYLGDVPPECPPEHVHAAVQAVQWYGNATQNRIEEPLRLLPRESFRQWAHRLQFE